MYETVFYEPIDVFIVYIVVLLSVIITYPFLSVVVGVVKRWK